MARKPTAGGSSDFVTVACRLPQGLRIELPAGGEVRLHGVKSPYAVAGHGMTQVRAADWEAIQATYAGAKWLAGEAVFALPDPASAADKAKERRKEDAGFDPIDPLDPNSKSGTGVTIQREGEGDGGMGT